MAEKEKSWQDLNPFGKVANAMEGQKNEGSTPPAAPVGNERTYKEGEKQETVKKPWYWPF